VKAIIAGKGKMLYFLCRSFSSKGHHVVIVDRDKEECVQLARQLTATVIHGDASDPGILKDAGAMDADVILAVTPDDQDNLVICQLAALQFGPLRTIALANDPENVEIFEKLGVTAFSTTHIVGSLIEQRASLEQIANLLPVGEGLVNITEILLASDSPVAGKRLADIELPENALVAVVIRDGRAMVPGGSHDLRANDRVVMISLPENHGAVLQAITGDTD
jgi:trk system potassium uptake protein